MWYGDIFNCISLKLGDTSQMTQKKLAKYKNNAVFQNIFARLAKKALARYRFDGLPETVNDRVLRQALLFHASVCFFEKEGKLLALPAMPDSNLTLYGDFKACWVYGRNGYNAKIPLIVHGGADSALVNKGYAGMKTGVGKGIWVRENELVYPFINYCIWYADMIADTFRTLDVTRKNIKRPYIISAEEQIIPSVKRFFENKDNNEEYIISSGVFPADKINVLPFDTNPENIKSATDLIEWYMNDFDSMCGKNSNGNPDKKERLLVDEVNSNNETTQTNVQDILDFMQWQLDDVNKEFGVNIKVVKEEPPEEDADPDGMKDLNYDGGEKDDV